MELRIDHLCRHERLAADVAHLIHEEFWKDVEGGMSLADLLAHFEKTRDPDRIPLCLVALAGDEFVGTVNLIDNDDRKRTHLHPWLAAMVVVEAYRGRGIGTRLVRSLLAEAARLGFEAVYFGTDGPRFYERLGATLHEQVTPQFCIMRFTLSTGRTSASP